MIRPVKLTIWAVLFSLMAISASPAQRLASALSSNTVSVDSSFSGETLTIFGNIEPDIGSDVRIEDEGYHIIILVQGPAIDRLARRKRSNLGIWLNTEQVLFKAFPSYFWIISSSRIENIASLEVLEEQGLLPQSQPRLVSSSGNGNAAELGKQLVRLMRDEGLYGVRENGVVFRSRTLYSASLSLPANVPNGDFLAQTFLMKDGKVIAKKAQGFSVRKTGFERLVGTTAKTTPLVYGLVCVLLAMFTGWLGGVVFRR